MEKKTEMDIAWDCNGGTGRRKRGKQKVLDAADAYLILEAIGALQNWGALDEYFSGDEQPPSVREILRL